MIDKVKFKFTVKKFIILLCSTVVFFTFVLMLQSLAKLPDNKEIWVEGFNENVDVYLNGNLLSSGIDITGELFAPFQKEDNISIQKKLKNINSDSATFIFHSFHSNVEIYLDDQLLYSFSRPDNESEKEIANKYHFVKLPNNCSGKTLKVNLYVKENDAFTYFDIFKLCISDNPIFYFYKPLLLPLVMNSFLMLLGIILALIGIIIALLGGKFHSFIYLAGVSFYVGLWSFCNYGFLDIFMDTSKYGNAIEYDSLFLSIYFYLLMISDLKQNNISPILLKINKIIKLVYSAALIVTFIAQIFNFLHSSDVLQFFHILSIISILTSIFMLSRNYKKQELYEKVLFIGQAILSLLMTIIALCFVLINFTSVDISSNILKLDFNIIGTVTMFVVIILFFSSYLMRFYEMTVYQKNIKLLEKMAYNDTLTGLENRQSCDLNIMKIINRSKDYHCILFDLNNLKITNDALGHTIGDQLIKSFADCLKKAFPENSIKSRIGGDEFLVVVDSADEKGINKYIDILYGLIDNVNMDKDIEFELSTSFGVAHSSEVAIYKNYESVIDLADERMYEQKRKYKNE